MTSTGGTHFWERGWQLPGIPLLNSSPLHLQKWGQEDDNVLTKTKFWNDVSDLFYKDYWSNVCTLLKFKCHKMIFNVPSGCFVSAESTSMCGWRTSVWALVSGRHHKLGSLDGLQGRR